MGRKAAKATMRTCTAPISDRRPGGPRYGRGFTLAETMVVVALIGLLLVIPSMNLVQMVAGKTFAARTRKLVSLLEMAGEAASQSDRRYEVIIDIPEQSYLLRQITTPDLSQVLEEEIIAQGRFGDDCIVSYVEFDDGDFTNDSRAKFRAGRAGWQYGGKIVLLDKDERPWSIVINRISRVVALVEGDAIVLTPKQAQEVMF
ncbi:MAG TPA: prepilin-type N-terminal cleavage/methylation domain-containing protein [Phycisphaerales bacterium]|nr:prepilin-type N-terminal cleavage/methylation domain-containing protein [Phycisphaerales bacterium]